MPDRRSTRAPLGRRCAALLLALALLGALLPGATPGRAARQPIGELYLALGDSLGVGLLTSMPDARGYVAQFHALLERQSGRSVALRNLSISGETARTMLRGGQLDAAQRELAEARRIGWRVSPITIDIGGNDLRALQGADNAGREAGLVAFRADIGQIFDTLVAATTIDGARTADIAAMTVYNPYGGDPGIARSDAWWVARFNAAIAEEAGRRGIAVADVFAGFLGNERALTWVPLDFHANNRGHTAIAETFWRAVAYDTVPPQLEIVAPAAGRVARGVPTIRVRASDAIGVVRVELRVDDQPLAAPLFARDLGLWIGYWDARAAAPGDHRLVVSVADAAGNVARQEITLTR